MSILLLLFLHFKSSAEITLQNALACEQSLHSYAAPDRINVGRKDDFVVMRVRELREAKEKLYFSINGSAYSIYLPNFEKLIEKGSQSFVVDTGSEFSPRYCMTIEFNALHGDMLQSVEKMPSTKCPAKTPRLPLNAASKDEQQDMAKELYKRVMNEVDSMNRKITPRYLPSDPRYTPPNSEQRALAMKIKDWKTFDCSQLDYLLAKKIVTLHERIFHATFVPTVTPTEGAGSEKGSH